MSSKERPVRLRPSPEWRQTLLLHYDADCAYCGIPFGLLPWRELTFDHMQPIASGAIDVHDASNVIPACRFCNELKSTGDLEALRGAMMRRTDRTLRALRSLLRCFPALQDKLAIVEDLGRAFDKLVLSDVKFLCETDSYAEKIRTLKELEADLFPRGRGSS
jgi:hypothetical protein